MSETRYARHARHARHASNRRHEKLAQVIVQPSRLMMASNSLKYFFNNHTLTNQCYHSLPIKSSNASILVPQKCSVISYRADGFVFFFILE